MKNTRKASTFTGFAAIIAAIVLNTLFLTGCKSPTGGGGGDSGPSGPPQSSPTVINEAAILGVTPPAIDGNPVTALPKTNSIREP